MPERLKSAAIALLALALSATWAYYEFWHKPEQRARKQAPVRADLERRLSQWAYIAKEKQISPAETLRLVVIPHSSGLDIMDIKCFIYTHKDFQKSQFLCPDAKQLDIEEP